jgi:Divergent AAA domain.
MALKVYTSSWHDGPYVVGVTRVKSECLFVKVSDVQGWTSGFSNLNTIRWVEICSKPQINLGREFQMDYIDWFLKVLTQIVEASRATLQARQFGVSVDEVARALFGADVVDQPGYSQSEQYFNLLHLFEEMKESGLLDGTKIRAHYKLWDSAAGTVQNPIKYWTSDCRIKLECEQEELLRLVNKLSVKTGTNDIYLQTLRVEELLSELKWSDGRTRLLVVANELKERGLIRRLGVQWRASYHGLVWETRRGLTINSQFIDGLVQDWETTSVEFKRELHLETADQKAELIKDVIGLANTQVSGRRLLVVGFEDKTRTYYGPPDPKVNQNRLEQIIAEYAEPNIEIQYDVLEYRTGFVATLEVRRESTKLPYRVAKALGFQKRIVDGQVFVRHGSQVEEPTMAELTALQDEANRAKGKP